ncbi:Pullulanase 1, chloroplastic [Vitis vinifera]|uniref:Pullulanase 1, chloroplastic n=1 Tax=Vitis vinifera TaxID=29760 RepID=A0A438ILT7_VITVI|nr:Pullulanase 1, chloroplastic [Vitis vinifera]
MNWFNQHLLNIIHPVSLVGRGGGQCNNVTGLQLPGVLDELFSYEGPLGAIFSKEAVTLYLWAPTAQVVHACIYGDPSGGDPLEIVCLEEFNGVWSASGPKSWEGCYYEYEVSVYHPSTLQIEKCTANDPYARGLSADGRRTLLVNLNSDDLKPEGWDNLADEKPALLSFSDISIYELHIRDFSASDHTVHPDFRGGYLAFTSQGVEKQNVASCFIIFILHGEDEIFLGNGGTKARDMAFWVVGGCFSSFVTDHRFDAGHRSDFGKAVEGLEIWHLDSAGILHLKKLCNAGISHLHLLPTFQFAGVDDEKDKWKCVDPNILETLPPDSVEQQAQIMTIQDEDGYNWGYNPVLWGFLKEAMQALNRIGFRVVLDVVYNHLHGSGPFDENSVLDKDLIEGRGSNWAMSCQDCSRLLLRRNSDGCIEHSACVNNTASEHFMVERLILDDLLCWAVDYKVDGFRFDLMGHIMKRTMVKAKNMLHSLSKDTDGIDGSSIYIYGEGWDFGEVAKNGRGVNASQFNLCGTGIGSFNDRIRDAMLGGSPFGHPLQQGFVTGLFLQISPYSFKIHVHILEELLFINERYLFPLALSDVIFLLQYMHGILVIP